MPQQYKYTAGWNMTGYSPDPGSVHEFTSDNQAEAAHNALDLLANELDEWAVDYETPYNKYDRARDRVRTDMEKMADTDMTGWLYYAGNMAFWVNEIITKVPDDFPVRPLGPDDPAKDRMTCGTCERSWDDAVPTEWTPAPSARCPFEYFH